MTCKGCTASIARQDCVSKLLRVCPPLKGKGEKERVAEEGEERGEKGRKGKRRVGEGRKGQEKGKGMEGQESVRRYTF